MLKTALDAIRRTTRLTSVGLGVVVGVVAGFWAAREIGSRAASLLAMSLALSVGIAFVLGRRRVQLSATRSTLSPRLREGQVVGVTATVTAEARATALVLVEELPAALGGPRRVAVPGFSSGQEVEHTYRLVPQRRGRYRIGPLHAEWQDPFGFTLRRLEILGAEDVIVHPRVERAADRVSTRAWEDPPVRPPVSRPWPTGFEFYGLRDYAHGDDPRRIVWRATAKTLDFDTGAGRYLVSEAEQGITDRIVILLDTDRAHLGGADGDERFEHAIRAVASIGVHHLEDGNSVEMLANDGPIAPTLRGRAKQVHLLDQLAGVEMQTSTLADGVGLILLAQGSAGAHHVIVTSHLDKDSTSRIRLLMDQGVVVLLCLVVDDTTEPSILHRAATLGCGVVELPVNKPMAARFRQIVTAARV